MDRVSLFPHVVVQPYSKINWFIFFIKILQTHHNNNVIVFERLIIYWKTTNKLVFTAFTLKHKFEHKCILFLLIILVMSSVMSSYDKFSWFERKTPVDIKSHSWLRMWEHRSSTRVKELSVGRIVLSHKAGEICRETCAAVEGRSEHSGFICHL